MTLEAMQNAAAGGVVDMPPQDIGSFSISRRKL
jgi:hypothetical protein